MAVKTAEVLTTNSPFLPEQRDSGGSYFWKEVLRVGSWTHPQTGRKVNVSSDRLDRIVGGTQEYLAAGNSVPFPKQHTLDPAKNWGFTRDIERRGDEAWALIEVTDEDAATKSIGKTVQGVSVMLERDVMEPVSGKKLPDCITHVAACLDPVVGGQRNFIQLSRGDDEIKAECFVYQLEEPMSEKNEETRAPAEALSRVAEALGLEKGADEAAVLAKAGELREGAEKLEQRGDALARAEAEGEALSTKLTSAEARIAALESEALARKTADAESYVTELKRKSAAAGSPIAEERLSRVRTLFEEGKDALAREIGDLYLEAVTASATVDDEGGQLARSGDAERALEVKKEAVGVVAQALSSTGYNVEVAEDGLGIAKIEKRG